MADEWLSLTDVSHTTGIPERTLRRYIDRHGAYLPTQRQGRVYRLAATALPIVQFIRAQYLAGESEESVQQRLGQHFAATVTVNPIPPAPTPEVTATDTAAVTDALTAIVQYLQTVTEQNAHLQMQVDKLSGDMLQLQQQLADQARTWERQWTERDQALIAQMREMMAGRHQSWWHRIFRRKDSVE